MYTKGELKKGLIGSAEFALFMTEGKTRFSATREDAIRSFIIPLVLLPITLVFASIYPVDTLSDNTATVIVFLYTLKTLIGWGVFFGAVYWIAGQIKRLSYFWEFVTVCNWLAVPGLLVFLPSYIMLVGGFYEFEEILPFMIFTMFYTCAFLGFAAALVLRIPLELGGFIAFISFALHTSSMDLLSWIGGLF